MDLIYCVLNFFSYCLDKVTFTEFVPWLCDDCKETEITRTTNSDAIPPGTNLVELSHAAQPVDDPIWSVSEKAKLLQLHLHFEIVSKDDLWPKYFNTPEATVDDIELFFFLSEARHQDKFDSMVQDMIGGEHALRALIPYRELLVFTSTKLPLRHWNAVNDRAPTEDDAQVVTDELGRGKRI
ncbi:hypothetical protein H5410_051187 [Solanum commersonii]|uniref:AIPP2-like SPOC-like domain-containing protein n=1 Tax=Solanum commersonii TaxID=4109 RepID=A0A9J5X075_SOLCO|nr:hypothetical protein H5410_051187 [Solanum commersonii]